MKRTQIVTHIMPTEIDEYSDIVDILTEASQYLDNSDWISIYATLNLSNDLISWKNSELQKDFFIQKKDELPEEITNQFRNFQVRLKTEFRNKIKSKIALFVLFVITDDENCQ